jgi:cell division transport system permease protein
VTAYLDDALSEDEQRALTQRAAEFAGVQSATWITREEALRRFREDLAGADLLEGIEGNPLPASIELTLSASSRTPEGLSELREQIAGLPGVTDLAEGGDWVEGYTRVLVLVRLAAVGLGGVLVVAALLIVGNTIRLAVYARSDELEILSLVGASRTYVRIPFLLEGGLLGVLGGLLALAALWLGFSLVSAGLAEPIALLLGRSAPRFFDAREAATLITLGSLLGLAGSAFATIGWRR